MATRAQILTLLATLAILIALPALGSRYALELAVTMMIFGLFSMSLNVLAGHVGSVPFGHAAFFAVGGYACAWLQTHFSLPLPVTFILTVLLTATVAAVLGYFCVKLNEIYFGMLTLAFSMLVWAVAFKWRAVTGGPDGVVGVPVPAFISTPMSFYWFTLAVTALSIGLLLVLSNSTMGKAFIAVRENQLRAGFLGIDVRLTRLVAFVIAGAFAGVAGLLLALNLRGMFPESAYWSQSGHVLLMVILGGLHSFVGPLLGTLVFYALEVAIGQYTKYWQLFLGIILIAVILVAPEGLIGFCRSLHQRFQGGRK